MSQWVQHISGQGEKWGIYYESKWAFQCLDGDKVFYLPKSEYRLCDPPEQWVDVTECCDWNAKGWQIDGKGCTWVNCLELPNGYRLRKVPHCDPTNGSHTWGSAHWAFKVEKKEVR